jgi:hypothetical protein
MADEQQETLEQKADRALGAVLGRIRNSGRAEEDLKLSQTAVNLAQVRQMVKPKGAGS